MKFPDIGYIISITLFFVFCGLSMLNSNNRSAVSELGTDTIAPSNLRRSAESFRLNLAVERHSVTIEDISKSESWSKFESRLSAYADRLELLREQRRSQSRLVMWLYLTSAISMLIFITLKTRSKKKTDQIKPIKMQNKSQ